MKYIEKTIESPSGHGDTCWPPACANIDLVQGKIHFVLPGYLDKAAKEAGKTPQETRMVSIPLASLPSWPALWDEALSYMVTTDPTFVGGIIKDL